MNFEPITKLAKSIKLTGGVFGKNTLLLVILIVCFTALALHISTWWFGLIVIFVLMALVYYVVKRTFDFAEKFPQAAIMEGAELLVHERITHAAKGRGEILPTDLGIDHLALSEEPIPLEESTKGTEE